MKKLLLTVAICLGIAGAARADVVNSADVNGLRTFTDTNTGLVWVDLDNFFNQSYNQMKSAVEAAGFTVADVTQVHSLLDTLPLPNDWPTYRSIMGGAPNRELIWGGYVPENPGIVSWAFAFNGDFSWSYEAGTGFGLDDVPNGGSDLADMNIWAFGGTAQEVPEPGTLAMLFAGGTGTLALIRKRARK